MNKCQIDTEYIRKRETLIPEAMKMASKQVGRKSPRWSACFLKTMDRLWFLNSDTIL